MGPAEIQIKSPARDGAEEGATVSLHEREVASEDSNEICEGSRVF